MVVAEMDGRRTELVGVCKVLGIATAAVGLGLAAVVVVVAAATALELTLGGIHTVAHVCSKETVAESVIVLRNKKNISFSTVSMKERETLGTG